MDKKQFTVLLISNVVAIFLAVLLAMQFVFVPPEVRQQRKIEANMKKIEKQRMNLFSAQQKMLNQFGEDFNEEVEKPQILVNFPDFEKSFQLSPMMPNIKTEDSKKEYKVSVNLKPFNNDPKNVDIQIKRNSISIFAKYKSDENDEKDFSQLSQTLLLPYKFDENSIKREKIGDYLVVTIQKIENKAKK